jgi:hypothetical protein
VATLYDHFFVRTNTKAGKTGHGNNTPTPENDECGELFHGEFHPAFKKQIVIT